MTEHRFCPQIHLVTDVKEASLRMMEAVGRLRQVAIDIAAGRTDKVPGPVYWRAEAIADIERSARGVLDSIASFRRFDGSAEGVTVAQYRGEPPDTEGTSC